MSLRAADTVADGSGQLQMVEQCVLDIGFLHISPGRDLSYLVLVISLGNWIAEKKLKLSRAALIVNKFRSTISS